MKNQYLRKLLNSLSLIEKIEYDRHAIFTQTNQALLFFFWGIGNIMQGEKDENDVVELEKIAQKNYGDIFSLQNLRLMECFAKRYPDINLVSRFSLFVTWEYIQLIVNLNSQEEGMFYVLLAVQKGLTIEEFEAAIKQDVFKQSIRTKKQISEIKRKFLGTTSTITETGNMVTNMHIEFLDNNPLVCMKGLFQNKDLIMFLNMVE